MQGFGSSADVGDDATKFRLQQEPFHPQEQQQFSLVTVFLPQELNFQCCWLSKLRVLGSFYQPQERVLL